MAPRKTGMRKSMKKQQQKKQQQKQQQRKSLKKGGNQRKTLKKVMRGGDVGDGSYVKTKGTEVNDAASQLVSSDDVFKVEGAPVDNKVTIKKVDIISGDILTEDAVAVTHEGVSVSELRVTGVNKLIRVKSVDGTKFTAEFEGSAE